ncbi:MAG: hypothetical protein F9K38_11445, partial [Pseudorhodoplanes sp.]
MQRFEFRKLDRAFIPELGDRTAQQAQADFLRQIDKSGGVEGDAGPGCMDSDREPGGRLIHCALKRGFRAPHPPREHGKTLRRQPFARQRRQDRAQARTRKAWIAVRGV